MPPLINIAHMQKLTRDRAEGRLSTNPMPVRHLNSEASSAGPAQR